ncbi:MAG: hypothetical protein Solumvirus3_9 [Solumvirus sp.]|uniref:Proliferating cell nuclear antigen n=1 Tax=Solumvirus sp. TaxID=2487773 RepID=A0A3G5AJR7_9VIRU|nr:MAG: hypothetical protein Solumvirus3_9 [Solumvirus sp.]
MTSVTNTSSHNPFLLSSTTSVNTMVYNPFATTASVNGSANNASQNGSINNAAQSNPFVTNTLTAAGSVTNTSQNSSVTNTSQNGSSNNKSQNDSQKESYSQPSTNNIFQSSASTATAASDNSQIILDSTALSGVKSAKSQDIQFRISGTISAGYSYRHLWGVIKQLCTTALITFNKDGFTITQTDAEGKVLISASILGHKILDYKFFVFQDGKEIENTEITVGVNSKDMSTALSACGRNHEFIFLINDMQFMEYRLNGNKASLAAGAHILHFHHVEETPFEEPSFDRLETKPNYTISINEFVGICRDVDKRQGKRMTITGYNNGLEIIARKGNNEIILSNEFGNCKCESGGLKILRKPDEKSLGVIQHSKDNTNGSAAKDGTLGGVGHQANLSYNQQNATEKAIAAIDKSFALNMNNDQKKMLMNAANFAVESLTKLTAPPQSFTLVLPKKQSGIATSFDIGVIKAFTKMKQICQHGSINFFIEVDKPLKLVASVDTYGVLKIYVNNH